MTSDLGAMLLATARALKRELNVESLTEADGRKVAAIMLKAGTWP